MTSQDPDWPAKADSNARVIEKEIESLDLGHWDNFKRDYKKFWEHSKQISEMFKNLKPIRKEDRERLWSKFREVCDLTKIKQKDEYDTRFYKSKGWQDYILKIARSARVETLFGLTPPDIDMMKALGKTLREAGRILSENKKDMLFEHKQECFDLIQEIQNQHDIWWEELKGYKARKHEDFQRRVRDNIERNRERLRKAKEALYRCQANADKLRSDISAAWNDNWASTASGWLSEQEDKISDIERSINQIEDWISEDEDKLR